MPHHEIRIEPQRRIQHNLSCCRSRPLSKPFIKVKRRKPGGRTLPLAAPNTVGNHRLSRESMSKNTASCASNSASSCSTSFWVCATDAGGIECPGIGIESW